MAGVDLRTIQELMGHKTVAMTLRYSHFSPAHQLDAVQRLNRKPTDTELAAERTAVAVGGEVLDLPREGNGPPQTRTGDPLIESEIKATGKAPTDVGFPRSLDFSHREPSTTFDRLRSLSIAN